MFAEGVKTLGGRGIAVVFAGLCTFAIALLSSFTYHYDSDTVSMLRVSFRHPGQIMEGCRELTPEEKERLPKHMRADKICSRERSPVRLVLTLSGKTLLDKSYRPGGFKHDWPSVAFEELKVDPGTYRLVAELYDSKDESSFYRFERDLQFLPGRVVTLDFGRAERRFELLSGNPVHD